MSKYIISDDRYPIVLRDTESGREWVLTGTVETQLARVIVDLESRLAHTEKGLETLHKRARDENDNKHRPKDNGKEVGAT